MILSQNAKWRYGDDANQKIEIGIDSGYCCRYNFFNSLLSGNLSRCLHAGIRWAHRLRVGKKILADMPIISFPSRIEYTKMKTLIGG